MKYVCQVCGYVYDEEKEKVPFEDLPQDWTCPLCGAPKAMFEKMEEKAEQKAEQKADEPLANPMAKDLSQAEEDFSQLSPGEISIIFSNLARGCEKQYQDQAKEAFLKLAKFFDGLTPKETDKDLSALSSLIKKDLDQEYKALRSTAEEKGDRGSLRAITWGEKVTTITKILLDRYEKEGEAFLENTNLFVCTVCGFLFVGENPPELCPVCKVPGWKFEKIEGRA